jgi:nucleoside-diphosphate kinase
MAHFKDEQTLLIVKPDGVQRALIGEVIRRMENSGLKLAGIKMVSPTAEHVEQHYLIDPEWKQKVGQKAIEAYEKKGLEPATKDPEEAGEKVLTSLKKYMTSGPVVPMVWQGAHAVELVRKLAGSTEPLSSDVGTIRGDYVMDSYQMADTDQRAVRNVVHASGDKEEAEKEIAHWFGENEIHKYRLFNEHVLYDVDLDGIYE